MTGSSSRFGSIYLTSENIGLAHSVVNRALAFAVEARAILGEHESSIHRVITIEDSYNRLSGLSLAQDSLYRQSLRCVEHGLHRAAHVMAWAAFMDVLEDKLATDGFQKLTTVRPTWHLKSVEDLRENHTEYQIIEAAQAVNLCSNTEKKALHGLLNKRNECAHPGARDPSYNEALGYITELLGRTEAFQARTYP